MKSNVNICLLFLLLFTACNKEELSAEMAAYVVVNGYNGGENGLEIAIDTTRYTAFTKIVQSAGIIGFGTVYTYRQGQHEQILTVRDTATKQVVFSKTVDLSAAKVAINFTYVDGKTTEYTPPAVDTATNKLLFYVNFPEDEAPFDMFLYRKDASTGEELRYYLAKDVKPGSWITVNYLAAPGFETTVALSNTSIYFTKAGTTDQWAFRDNESVSRMSAGGLYLPVTGEKGLVQPYYLLPKVWQLEHARMFFYPGRAK
ncbi:hypothetical protein MKQ68_15220 [Chitinophaga horti]|uniref:DUF4397 domain-containing protein n=1 Tax=Chitinophaga horti TaxID=2920382 RepID=A0ABY6IZW5_9BACT|nr:hypothetical protein [Chitinophaga horti]UYQ91442.1 hypothetical protein MKQ68_15220 [Chitinophaga horti]